MIWSVGPATSNRARHIIVSSNFSIALGAFVYRLRPTFIAVFLPPLREAMITISDLMTFHTHLLSVIVRSLVGHGRIFQIEPYQRSSTPYTFSSSNLKLHRVRTSDHFCS